jgi:hypothetical protein
VKTPTSTTRRRFATRRLGYPSRFVGVTAGLAAALLLATGTAHADGASGGSNHYDGRDPSAGPDFCNANASQIATRPVVDRDSGRQVATIQVFYSWSCHANWMRVTANPYGGNANKNISSALGGWNSESDFGSGSSYSMMVYAPGDTHVTGDVYLFEPGINEYNWRASGSFAL